MEEVISGPVVLTWDPSARIAFISFQRSTIAVGHYAGPLVDAMRRWIGNEHKPFALLGDGKDLTFPDADYRQQWGSFFKDHREESYIAFFNMSDTVRMAAGLFGAMFRLNLRTFSSEIEARDWIREKLSLATA